MFGLKIGRMMSKEIRDLLVKAFLYSKEDGMRTIDAFEKVKSMGYKHSLRHLNRQIALIAATNAPRLGLRALAENQK